MSTNDKLADSPSSLEIRQAKHRSYGQILKSSALIGGSSAVNVVLGIVRTKVIALLLGTTGFGIMGMYSAILDLTHTIAGMGVNSSGVRQIAEAVGTGETSRIARTAMVLRRTAILLGLLGAALLFVFAKTLSVLTFETSDHVNAIRMLSLAVFFTAICRAQGALLQGMRRISDLARIAVLGGLFGSVSSILLVVFFREEGIAPALVSVAAFGILTTWWYSRKVRIPVVHSSPAEVKHEAGALLKLGFAFMASAVLTTGAAYVIRLLVLKQVSVEAAGLYQAAWAIGGLYVGVILESMGADFYPRLTAIARDNHACNRLVNEQARISLLLAGPGVLATLTFAPVVIIALYSTKFLAAVEILRWICLGMALRVIAWPMGYIVLAKGAQRVFFWTEVVATIVHVGVAWLLIPHVGAAGAGMAFFGLYVWHAFFIYFIVRWLSGFRWSSANRQTGLLFVTLIGVAFTSFLVLSPWMATGVGLMAFVICCIYSIRVLANLLPLEQIPFSLLRSLVGWSFRVGILKRTNEDDSPS